jgi:hypothetical protein
MYDGTASNVTAAAGELAEGDKCEVIVIGGNAKDTGTYTATATGLSNSNYQLPENVTTTYEITPREAVLRWKGTANRTYDGTASQVTAEVSNLVEGDTCEVTVTGGDASAAGTYTATAESLSNSNYQLPEETTQDYTIIPKIVSLTWKGTGTRTYDGTESNVTVEAGELIEGDECAVTVIDGDAIDAGTYTAMAAELSDPNYQLPEEATQAYTITPKTVSLTWEGTETRTYDGTESNVMAEAGELIEGDECAVTVTGGDATDAGTYTAKATKISNKNYQLPTGTALSTTYTIAPRTVKLTWNNTKKRIYNGNSSNVTAKVTNLVSGDTCKVTVKGGTEKKAGTHTAMVTALSNANYQLPDGNVLSTSYTITPKTVTLKWSGAATRTYDGKASKVTASVSNLVSGDKCTVTVTNGKQKNAGTYTATAASLSNANYQLPSKNTRSYKINKASQKITIGKALYTGIAGKTITIKVTRTGTGKLTYTSSNTAIVKMSGSKAKLQCAGSVTITVSAAATTNYKAALKTVKVLISPKQMTLSSVGSPKKSQIKAVWKKQTGVTGYEIQYSTSSKFAAGKTGTVTVEKASQTSKTIESLTAGQKYYVRVRAYKTINGKKYYGTYSTAKQVTVKKK